MILSAPAASDAADAPAVSSDASVDGRRWNGRSESPRGFRYAAGPTAEVAAA